MKKIISLLMMLTMIASLCACTALKEVEGAPESSAQPETVEELQPPEESVTPEEPQDEAALAMRELLGHQILVNIDHHEEDYLAPDDSGKLILTFVYDTATVHIEGNDAASERINNSLAVMDESFYSGGGIDGGVNGMLEQATDNYTLAVEMEDDRSIEFSSSRTVGVARSDSKVLTLIYRTQTFTGLAHNSSIERAYVFNSETGERLTFAALCDSDERTDALKAYLIEKMAEQASAEDSGVDMSLFEEEGSLENKLSELIREATWYLDNDGLVIFSDIYELGGYDAGILRFRFSYDEISDYMSERWLPPEREENGRFAIAYMGDVPAGSTVILDRIVIDPEGEDICLLVDGTVYDVSVISVRYVNDDVGFYETAQHWSCSYVNNAGIQLAAHLPEGMPDLMIRYTSADGERYDLYVTQSGEDGSLLLTDDSIEAVG